MIEDFVMKGPLVFRPGRRVLDYERIVVLPERDFAQLYLELMLEYRDKDGWWSNGKIPKCNKCHDVILSPQQLRRYYGSSMHPSCFKQFYERRGDEEGIMGKYWQRVANLVISSTPDNS